MPDSLRFLSVYLVKIGIRYNRYIENRRKRKRVHRYSMIFTEKTQQGAKNLDKARRNVYKCKVRFAGMYEEN